VAELGFRVLLSLGVVLGLFWAVARMGARRVGGRDRTLLRVRSRQALSRGSSIAVVEVGSRVLVVGVSDAGVRLLTELDPFELDSSSAVLTEPSSEPTPAARVSQVVSPLGGSLFAPATWKQAWSAATGRPYDAANPATPEGQE
jgi:flagellar protein FliO/FliZ